MKKECEIINDLLPNYVENLVSEETKKFVNEHISNCEQCKKQLEILREDRNKINIKSKNEQKIELDYLKKYNKKMILLKIILITIMALITILIAFSIYRYIYNSKVVENVERKISEITDLNNYHIYETQYYKFNQNNEENYYTTEIFYKDGKYKKIEKINSKNSELDNKEFVKYWSKDEILNKSELLEYETYNKTGELIMRMPNIYLGEGMVKAINIVMLNIRIDEFKGTECYVLRNSDKSSYREIWIDKETMLPMREIQNIYGVQYDEKNFFIEINVVTDKDVSNIEK